MLDALILSALVSSGGSWTQILLTNQLQCRDAYTLTIGYPQGEKDLVARVELGGKTLAEKKLGKFTGAQGAIFDADGSQCEEALVDLAGETERLGLFVSFPKNKAKITVFPAAPASASPAKRNGASLRVYTAKKAKLCVTDYRVANDDLGKTFEDCY